jgi:hypothetical protein
LRSVATQRGGYLTARERCISGEEECDQCIAARRLRMLMAEAENCKDQKRLSEISDEMEKLSNEMSGRVK